MPSCEPRYNIAPPQLLICIQTNPETKEREFAELEWGLLPSWAKIPASAINSMPEEKRLPVSRLSVRHFTSNGAWYCSIGFMNGSKRGNLNSRITSASRMIALSPLRNCRNGGRNRSAFKNLCLDYDRLRWLCGTHPSSDVPDPTGRVICKLVE